MPASHLEFLVEEPSMESFLGAFLPKLLPHRVTFKIHSHRGKQALLRKLERRLKGYRQCLQPNWRIIVVLDRDREDCRDLKSRLEKICHKTGLQSKRVAGGTDWQIVTRIAIEELEAWYFGDWQAVQAAYPRVSSTVPGRDRYREPDAIKGGTWEALERILRRGGYFKEGLPKIRVAEEIGPHINPQQNRSPSFRIFVKAILEAIE